MSERHEVVIVGGGIAGACAALRAAQYNLPGVWVTGDGKTAKRSRAQWVYNVDNMLGVHPDIVLTALRKQWRKQPELLEALDALPTLHISTKAMIENARERIDASGAPLEIRAGMATGARGIDGGFEVEVAGAKKSDEGVTLRTRTVVLATGVMDTQPLIAKRKGDEVVDATKWIYPYANLETVLYCIRCEGHLTQDTRTAVIGCSETSAQIGIMLAERYGSTVALLTNGELCGYGGDTARLLEHHGIEVVRGRLVDVLGVDDAPRGTLKGFVTEEGRTIEVDYAFVSLGLYRVYNELARQLGAELADDGAPDERRHVVIDSRGRTSVPGLFAIGDMTRRDREDEPVMKQIYTCQEYAVRAVDVIERGWRYRRREQVLEG